MAKENKAPFRCKDATGFREGRSASVFEAKLAGHVLEGPVSERKVCSIPRYPF
jgi:hypothetical protein